MQVSLKSVRCIPFSPPVKNTSPKTLKKPNNSWTAKSTGIFLPGRDTRTWIQLGWKPRSSTQYVAYTMQTFTILSQNTRAQQFNTIVTTHAGVKSLAYEEEVVSEQLSGASAIILTWKMLFAAAHRFVSTHAALTPWLMMLSPAPRLLLLSLFIACSCHSLQHFYSCL